MTLQEFTKQAKDVHDRSSSGDFQDSFDKKEKELYAQLSEKNWKDIHQFLLVCVEVGFSPVVECGEKLLEKRKLIEWKSHMVIFDDLFSALMKQGMTSADDHEDLLASDYIGLVEKTINLLKSIGLLANYEEKLYQLLTQALSTTDNRLILPCINVVTTIPWKKHGDWISQLFHRCFEIVQDNPELPDGHNLHTVVDIIFVMSFVAICQDGKKAMQVAQKVTEIFKFCAEQEWMNYDDGEKHTISHKLCSTIMQNFLLYNKEKKDIIKPMYSTVKKLWKCDDEDLQRFAEIIVTSMGALSADVMGDDVDELIQQYLDGDNKMLIAQFQTVYKTCPEKFHPHVDEFAAAMEGGEDWVFSTTLSLMWEMSKNSPQSFSQKTIEAIVQALPMPNVGCLGMLVLSALAQHKAQNIAKYDETIIAVMKKDDTASAHGAQVLVHLASVSEKHATKYLKVLQEVIEKASSMMSMSLVFSMRTIGASNPKLLEAHREFFYKLLQDPALKEHAQGVIDIMEGRTLKNISKDVEGQKQDITILDTRVTDTEGQVKELDKNISTAQNDIAGLRTDVDEQGVLLDEVEELAEETADKVVEIDKKTLSHAPVWSRDVARIMNELGDHDWRLLSTRLGYTKDDIRNWATQPDPCLSMMDEWFATHKTREATFAILQALQEMNRADAAMIVENALKLVEGVIEDEDEEDTGPPPPVFLSYQWGYQDEVRLLKKHLEMAGYPCWMDIGQMGGGDKLFAKIDQGIRAAKVVICCVTEKYAASPNCNREVNLSVTLGKPMLPLLIENMSWPPAGSMGPIFGEYLFIRFFARGGEKADDDRYWPTAKFTELLMQIRFNVAPDHEIVDPFYANWWSPPEEIIVIKPREEKSGSENKAQVSDANPESPEIFISYQWGKQPQIKALYSRLTAQGYKCWLDILQMGGGDSLYDKIDRGVRGCQVVLCCVTSKYSLSANCRKEVSLADAIKKPIIPLFLEQITWPPEGPMSMVFTQLLYINFCKPDVSVQDHWDCPQFQELLDKVQVQILPVNQPTQRAITTKETTTSTTTQKPAAQSTEGQQNGSKSGQEKPESFGQTKKSGLCNVL